LLESRTNTAALDAQLTLISIARGLHMQFSPATGWRADDATAGKHKVLFESGFIMIFFGVLHRVQKELA
jgi:hypothetical protein